jgi:NADPH:quinone reductase
MHAVWLHEFNTPLRYEAAPEPRPGADEALVEVRYSAVNPLDIAVTRGTVAGGTQRLPFIVGSEGAGVADGKPVLVHGHGLGLLRDGTYAERVAVPRGALHPLPEGVDLQQAAALGIAGVTAWRAARDLAALQPADRAVVLGASGGVGSLIVQLAKGTGATVWGQVGSPDKAALVEGLGADRAVVATAATLVETVADLKPTVIFDALGDGFTGAAIEALQPHGRLILFGAAAGPRAEVQVASLYRKGLTVYGYGGFNEPPDRLAEGTEKVVAELMAGRLRVPIDEVLPLAQAAEAHRRLLDRAVRGKILLQP